MGKTTLWNAGVAAAADAGLCALRARPFESETTLSFSGIRDVLDPFSERVLGCFPEAQRRALSRALVLEEDEGPPPDPHAVGVAVLGALRELSATESLVIAVDDAQWLDEASSAALAFAGRRLDDEPVGLLLARRTGWTARWSRTPAIAARRARQRARGRSGRPERAPPDRPAPPRRGAPASAARRGALGRGWESLLCTGDCADAPALGSFNRGWPPLAGARDAARARARPLARPTGREP